MESNSIANDAILTLLLVINFNVEKVLEETHAGSEPPRYKVPYLPRLCPLPSS
jgi:hypothetical protein